MALECIAGTGKIYVTWTREEWAEGLSSTQVSITYGSINTEQTTIGVANIDSDENSKEYIINGIDVTGIYTIHFIAEFDESAYSDEYIGGKTSKRTYR